MTNNRKNKYMVLDDRNEIQEHLNKGMTFQTISERICKDPTNVLREVKQHSQTHTNSFVKTDECCPNLLKIAFS